MEFRYVEMLPYSMLNKYSFVGMKGVKAGFEGVEGLGSVWLELGEINGAE